MFCFVLFYFCFFYFILFFYHICWKKKNEHHHIFFFYSYLPLALIDVEANFLVVLAFQYTDLSSVMLLDCWAIPCVMVISHFWLGHRFVRLHFIGAALCVLGIVIIVIVDWAQHGIASGLCLFSLLLFIWIICDKQKKLKKKNYFI